MKFFKYILLVAVIGITTNCTDLEEEAFTFVTPNNLYRDADDLNMSVIAIYDSYQNVMARSRTIQLKLEVLTKFQSPSRHKDNAHNYNVWMDINNPWRTFNQWGPLYYVINRANVVLDRGVDIEMEQVEKEQMYGEARFFRALSYYYLIRLYGGVPIPDRMTDGIEGLEIPRRTIEENYDYIIADLEYAISKLPVKSTYDENQKWRATKGSAQGILNEVYLTRGFMTGNSEYLTKSKQYAAELIQTNEYDLEPDFKDLWLWYNTGNKNGIESIFEIQHGKYPGEDNESAITMGINLVDISVGRSFWHRIVPSIEHYLSYSDNDARKEGSFVTKAYITEGGDPTNIVDSIEFVPADNGFYGSGASKGWRCSGPGCVKYLDKSPEAYELNMGGVNQYVMRYADVLLNYAEAENELNGPTADAYEKINEVRNRANLPDLTAGLSKEAFADSLYKERGWEFVGEMQLYFDGLRTDRIGDDLVEHNANAVAQGIMWYRPLEFVPKKSFLWKIPPNDLDSNPLLEQNPDNVSK